MGMGNLFETYRASRSENLVNGFIMYGI